MKIEIKIVILLLKFIDWVLRRYIHEPNIYKKGYFVEPIIFRLNYEK